MAAGPFLDDRDPRRGKKVARAVSKRGGGSARGGGAAGGWNAVRVVKLALWAGVFAAFAGVAALVGLFAFYGSDPNLPKISKLDDFHPKQVTRVLDRSG